jgi:hypothetical protein
VKQIELVDGSKFFENKIATEFITTKVASQILEISENALRIKVFRGKAPHYKFNRSLRFRVSEISKLFHRKEELWQFQRK